MPDPRQYVLAGAGLLAGPPMIVRGVRDLRTRQIVENTPTARIRSMAMGLVEVNGTVEARSLATAPFSGRRCVYWQVEVAVRTSRRGGWRTVHAESSGQPFFLRDETGVALVYPHGAECRVRHAVEEECHGLALPELYAAFLAERRLAGRFLWRLAAMRFRERVLEEGQQVYVLATAVPRSRAHAVSDGEALAATGTDGAPWTRRARDAGDEVVAVLRRGAAHPVFVISQSHEGELAFALGLKGAARLAGGTLLTLGGLALLLDALRWANWLH
uniref:RING-type E3 ubiquitin transferase n=1 Tax=Eiseniibacteriota bacterium TaxID=2212470 RepID=A0A832I5H1_UNCEI